MKKMSVIFALFFAFTVCAQDSQEQDSLDELFKLMNMDAMINTTYDQMQAMFAGIEKDAEISSEEKAINEKYQEQLINLMKTEMSWKAMKVDIKQVYLQNFTENEIVDMAAFYKSPTGQSVLRTMPIVMQESMQIGQAMAQKTMPKIQELLERRQQERQELRDSSN